MEAKDLSQLTGCSLSMCKAALEYSKERNGGYDMAISYLKAKSFAVKTNCSFDERVMRFCRNN